MNAWLEQALANITADPTAIRALFPAAGRKAGQESADAARMQMLIALGDHLDGELPDLYRYGDTAERLAILRAFDGLGSVADLLSYARDALRSNDPRLVVAALGHRVLESMAEDERNHAVMKCVFMGIQLAQVDGLAGYVNPKLSHMLATLVHERVAAGRDIAPDVWSFIDAFPPEVELIAIEAELQSPVDDRRRAAEAALKSRRR